MTKSCEYQLSDDLSTLLTPQGETWVKTHLTHVFSDHANRQFHISFDKPGICLARASITHKFLPSSYQTSIHAAELGFVKGKGMVSIEPLLQDSEHSTIKPLDELIFEKKHDSTDLPHYDAHDQQQIRLFIESLSWTAKQDLAHALFASAVFGDECLHLGQWIAVINRQDPNLKVEHIIRIDFGARELFAKKRMETNDVCPTKTSKPFAGSDQSGQDYISYFLACPTLKSQFLLLWAKADIGIIIKRQRNRLSKQLALIPENEQKVAISEFLDRINQEAKAPLAMKNFSNSFELIVSDRCNWMQNNARNEIKKLVLSTDISELTETDRSHLKTCLTTTIKDSVSDSLFKTLDKIHHTLTSALNTLDDTQQHKKEKYQLLINFISAEMQMNSRSYHHGKAHQKSIKDSLMMYKKDLTDNKISATVDSGFSI